MKVAAAHISPVFMDAAATTQKAVQWIEQAQQQGLDLIVFPEAFIPGFPVNTSFSSIVTSLNVLCDGRIVQPLCLITAV